MSTRAACAASLRVSTRAGWAELLGGELDGYRDRWIQRWDRVVGGGDGLVRLANLRTALAEAGECLRLVTSWTRRRSTARIAGTPGSDDTTCSSQIFSTRVRGLSAVVPLAIDCADHLWNGITTLAWAELAARTVEGSGLGPGIHQPTTAKAVTKDELLRLFVEVFEHRVDVRPVKTEQACDRTLLPTTAMPPLRQQMIALRAWMSI